MTGTTKPRRWGRHLTPAVIAHRGASADAPENTMAAFRLAAEQGADGVELDVMRCRSGEVVVFHDYDLSRLAGRPESIADLDYAALQKVRIDGQPIPLLSEVLTALPALGGKAGGSFLCNVELKTSPSWGGRVRDDGLVHEVAALIERHHAGERVLVSSFDPMLLWRFRRASPHVATGLLFDIEQSLPFRHAWAAAAIRPAALHPAAALVDRIAVDRWRKGGYAVNVWTVDHPAELRFMATLGIDGVITNRPAAAARVLAEALAPQRA